ICRDGEGPPIPQIITFPNMFHHARERGLNRKRDQNLAIRLSRPLRFRIGVALLNREVPKPIQIQPIVADHLWARIFLERVLWRDLFCPLRSQRSEEHTSELQSRFGMSYAVFCLK